ncbi:MAG: CHAT domain-containing tetratricopeptide repeat protein [Candidatus Zixiibacteriota bacterium]
MLLKCLLLTLTFLLTQNSTPALASSEPDSLDFGSRFELYRYLQRGLENYFDTGDTVLFEQIQEAANFVLTEYGDDFYVRQCSKFKTWKQHYFLLRSQLKLQFSTNLEGLAGNKGPVEIYSSQMAELGNEFLAFGDSSSAANSWQHAAARGMTTELADKILNQSLNLSRLIGDLDALSRSYNLLGRLLSEKLEFIKAGAYFDSARVIKAELGDRAGVAECLSNIASIYLSIGDKHNARRFAEESLALRRALQDSTSVYTSLVTMIPAFAREVQVSQLNEWFDEATALGVALPAKSDPVRLTYCRAILAELKGDLDSAITLYDEAVRSSMAANSHRLALAVLQNYAALESSLGYFTQSLEHYLQAEDLAVKTRNRVALATIFHNLGSLHQQLGDLESAIDYYQRALDIRRQVDLRLQSGETLGNLSELYCAVGDTTAALDYAAKSAEIAGLSNDRRGLSNSLIARARIEQALGNHRQAIQLLDSASTLQAGVLTLQRRIDLLCLRSDFSRENKDLSASKDLLARAEILLDSCRTYSNSQKIDIIHSNIAIDESRWHDAYRYLARIIARSEKSRGSIPDEQLRGSFQSQARSVYEEMVKTLFHIRQSGNNRDYDDSLLIYIERAKSRGLLDIIAERSSTGPESKHRPNKTGERQLLREIEQVESSLADDSIPRSVKAKVAKLSDLEKTLSDLRLKAGVANAAAVRVYTPEPIAIMRLQSALPDSRTVLISYLLTPDESYALLICKTQIKTELLPGREILTPSISEFMRLIQLSIKNDSLLDSLYTAAAQVGQLLLPKSLLVPDSFDRILISSDGVLSILPFEALRIDGKYLIEYAAVAALPSLFLFSPQELGPRRTENWHILALADPRSDSQQRQLPFSAREVDWICGIFGANNCTILTASTATKAELLRLRLADYRIFHAATHSTINYRDPARSKIWLSDDTTATNAESYLTLAEVDELKLSADLVVLSSCESGGGKLDVSEGMDGFVKAFMQAGAHNLLVSLWEVEDFTTATFMKTFYQNLSSGYAEALRRAKLEMINSPRLRHRHPYYWSPFTLTVSGD